MNKKRFENITDALKAAEGLALLGKQFTVESNTHYVDVGRSRVSETIKELRTFYTVSWEEK